MCKGDKFRCYAFSSTFAMYSLFCILISLFLMFNAQFSYAQWTATYGGFYSDTVQQTNDGGYIVGGVSGGDIVLLKLDADGAIQWQKACGGSSSEYVGEVRQTNDGGYIAAGSTSSYGAGNTDVLVLKFDANGNIKWKKTYGKSAADWAYSIQQTSDGGYIVAGFTSSFGVVINGKKTEIPDAWILKLDASGNIQWQKVYGTGTTSDSARCIQQTSDGGYIVAGLTFLSTSGANADIWVFKLDDRGNIKWQKTVVDKVYKGGGGYEYARSVQETSDGGFIITGNSGCIGNNPPNFWVLKFDSGGDLLWQKAYDNDGIIDEWANSIQQTSDDGYIVAGRTHTKTNGQTDAKVVYAILKLDSNGAIQWQKLYERSGYAEARSIQQTSDGGYIVTGMSTSGGFWVLKLASDGTIGTSCDFIRDAGFSEYVNSGVIIVDTTASARNSSAKVRTAYAKVSDATASANYICYSDTFVVPTTTTTTTTIQTTTTTMTPTTSTTTTTLPTSSFAKICVTPPSKFSLTRGQTQCATIQIWNCGQGTLSWMLSENCSWLTLSPTSGTSTGDTNMVQACVDTTDMVIGGYKCTVTVTAQGATNSPQTFEIELEIQ